MRCPPAAQRHAPGAVAGPAADGHAPTLALAPRIRPVRGELAGSRRVGAGPAVAGADALAARPVDAVAGAALDVARADRAVGLLAHRALGWSSQYWLAGHVGMAKPIRSGPRRFRACRQLQSEQAPAHALTQQTAVDAEARAALRRRRALEPVRLAARLAGARGVAVRGPRAGGRRVRVLRSGRQVDARAERAGHAARLAGAGAGADAADAVDAVVAGAVGGGAAGRAVRLLAGGAGARAVAGLARGVARRGGAVIDAAAQDRRSRSRRAPPDRTGSRSGRTGCCSRHRRCRSRSCTGRPRCTTCRWPSRGSGRSRRRRTTGPGYPTRCRPARRSDLRCPYGTNEQVPRLPSPGCRSCRSRCSRCCSRRRRRSGRWRTRRTCRTAVRAASCTAGWRRRPGRSGRCRRLAAGRHVAAGPELAGDVAGHAGARALRGGHRAADAVDAVAGRAARRAGRRAARRRSAAASCSARYSQISCGP